MGDQDSQVSPAQIFARPTAEDIWLGPFQREALSQFPSPCQLILGPKSSGKTSLLWHLSAKLDDAVVLKLSGRNRGSLLEQMLRAAEFSPSGLSARDQQSLLMVFATRRRSQGREPLVLIDNVERLDDAQRDELEQLMRMRFDGQSGFRFLLGFTGDGQEWQRTFPGLESECARAVRLSHLSEQQVEEYVGWRLARFELPELFTALALRLVARSSEGRIGAVDVLCQMAMLLMRSHHVERVDGPLIQQAAMWLSARRRSTDDSGIVVKENEELSQVPAGSLLVSRDGESVGHFALGPRLLIGRSEHNDLWLPSPYLSRHHAVIVGTTDGYYVVDLNSVNGLLINGQLVHRAILHSGDVICIGPYRLKVGLEGVPVGDPLPPAPSLDDTAVMPPRRQQPPFRVIK